MLCLKRSHAPKTARRAKSTRPTGPAPIVIPLWPETLAALQEVAEEEGISLSAAALLLLGCEAD